jgi:hypothetical protein
MCRYRKVAGAVGLVPGAGARGGHPVATLDENAVSQPPCATRDTELHWPLVNWRLWLVVVIVAVVAAVAGSYAYRTRRAAANRAAVQAAFLKYSQTLKPGVTRKAVRDYLTGQGIAFKERCCHEADGPYSVLVEVGKEDAPWYCSEWPDYVAFEFSTTQPLDSRSKPSDSDVLKEVHLTSNGEGCL